MSTLLVQLADDLWTTRALEAACQLARQTHSQVVLVRLIPTPHIRWLGSEYAYQPWSVEDQERLMRFDEQCAQSHIELGIFSMVYHEWSGAMAEVASTLNATDVFARVPHSLLPFWQLFQSVMLRVQLRKTRVWLDDNMPPSASFSVANAHEIQGLYETDEPISFD